MNEVRASAVCLMGPTAAGKTDTALALCKRFPFEIISVDSALVYRGMDIGTAKPDAATLKRAPHRLVDIREPEETYSAGDFVRDARHEMSDILAAGRIPLLVGGTMMYFRALTEGIAELPAGDTDMRAEIDREAARKGWPALHAALASVDARAAGRIAPNDSQRIQRALEVYRLSGKPLSDWQDDTQAPPGDTLRFVRIGLHPGDRKALHARIEARLNLMLNNGFIEEVKVLSERPGLTPGMPSMRAVGYRQLWRYVDGQCDLDEARYRALVATRQLAKRQLTWLRSERELFAVDPLEAAPVDAISAYLAKTL